MQSYKIITSFCLFLSFCFGSVCLGESSYEQHKNIVYAETAGVGLVLDVFIPKGKKSGLAIVDVASGAWHSDRGKIRDHKRSRFYETMCQRGFIVFAVRPGSITKFTGKEMLKNVHTGIKWVKAHAKEYSIDPDRLGLIGASAGGHLASLAGLTADDESRVAVVAVFFPPTDLVNYGKPKKPPTEEDIKKRKIVIHLLTFGKVNNKKTTPEEYKAELKAISPYYQVTESAPPFLLIHGDADERVPLEHSQKLLAKLKEKGIPAELIIKKGGGHPWLTIHEEVIVMGDWLVKKLAKQ
jgi:acetyl esterase/lipase